MTRDTSVVLLFIAEHYQRRSMNAYDVERAVEHLVPLLRDKLESLSESAEKAMLGELLALIAMIGGVSADGSRRAQEVYSSIPTISYPSR